MSNMKLYREMEEAKGPSGEDLYEPTVQVYYWQHAGHRETIDRAAAAIAGKIVDFMGNVIVTPHIETDVDGDPYEFFDITIHEWFHPSRGKGRRTTDTFEEVPAGDWIPVLKSYLGR